MPTKSKAKAKSKATKGTLNKKQLAHLEKRLHEERARVMKELGYYDESFNSSLQASDGDLSSYSFHMADQGTDAMEREKAFLFASQEGRYLWHVNQALRRLFQAPEKFGKCEQCGEEIGFERLDAMPHARLCIKCKAKEEDGKRRCPSAVLGHGGRGRRGRRRHGAARRVAAGGASAGPGNRRLRAAAPGLQQVRGVRTVPWRRDLLALDFLRARHRRAARAALDGPVRPPGRPVPAVRPRARLRRRRGERGRPHPQRPGRRGLRRRRHRRGALADVQRRRLGHHRRGDRARGLPLARGPAAAPWGGGPGGGAVMAAVTFCIAVPQTERLDRFLADQLPLSRPVAARLIADKRVTTAGRPLRASVQLERGALVSVGLPPPDEPPPRSYAPAHRDLTFVYEDAHLAVLDKPAGLVVHPGPGHWDDTLVNVLVGRGTALSQGSTEGRPGIVHRLDRDTSGLLLVAKTDEAHRRLALLIERRQVTRVYAAVAWGHVAKSPVTIEAPIMRHPKDRKRMTVLAGGRPAGTPAEVAARSAQTDLLRAALRTGRPHQIRVQPAYVGHPIVGDRDYAFGGSRRVTPSERRAAERLEARAPRQLLHT